MMMALRLRLEALLKLKNTLPTLGLTFKSHTVTLPWVVRFW